MKPIERRLQAVERRRRGRRVFVHWPSVDGQPERYTEGLTVVTPAEIARFKASGWDCTILNVQYE